jgi:molybdate transport system substrate-binding protein
MRFHRTFSPSTPSQGRVGRASAIWLTFLASAVLLAGLIVLLVNGNGAANATGGSHALLVYCAPAIKKPVEAAARNYEQESGVRVELDYGASQTLLTRIEVARRGDLFIPADDSYIDSARKKGLVDEVLPLARMKPVLAVGKGNPKGIRSLDDLRRADVKVSVAEPGAAVHRIVQEALVKSGQWPGLENKLLMNGTVADVANGVKIGSIDAGFIWDGMLPQYPELEAVPLDVLAGTEGRVAVAVLRTTTQQPAAARLARYLAAPDKGMLEFQRNGYDAVSRDATPASAPVRPSTTPRGRE